MNIGMISSRYARALYDSAKKLKMEDKVYQTVGELISSLKKSENLKKIFQQPLLSMKQKKEYFYSSINADPIPVLNSFIDIVFVNRREELLQFIFLKYQDIYRHEKNILSGKLITASGVNTTVETRLVEFLESVTNGTLEMEKQVNPAIIGGFILEVNHQRWDASVSGQLNTLKNKFTEQNRKTI